MNAASTRANLATEPVYDVSGFPMASALFAGQPLDPIVLPLMIFYRIQAMACAALARHYASAQKTGSLH